MLPSEARSSESVEACGELLGSVRACNCRNWCKSMAHSVDIGCFRNPFTSSSLSVSSSAVAHFCTAPTHASIGGPNEARQYIAILRFASSAASDMKQTSTLCSYGLQNTPSAIASHVCISVRPVSSLSVSRMLAQYGCKVGQLQNMW